MKSERHLEPAVPEHLRTQRTRQNRVPDHFVPSSPSYSARFSPNMTHLAVANIGVQYQPAHTDAAAQSVEVLKRFFAAENGPGAFDAGGFCDASGYGNFVLTAYWDSLEQFDRWQDASGFRAWWDDPARSSGELGYFAEFYRIGADRLETIFGDTRPDGCAQIADRMSGEIREHAYWGGARDRLAISQVDYLDAQGQPRLGNADPASGRRVRVEPHENLCMVRFGQDLTFADEAERHLYAEKIEPPLMTGMDYLENKGVRIGCLSNRFLTMLAPDGASLPKSYSISMWQSVAHLERWAEAHHTHLSIFVAAMKYFGQMRGQHKLRLYHEMCVIEAKNQWFEYINCHDKTGMLNSI